MGMLFNLKVAFENNYFCRLVWYLWLYEHQCTIFFMIFMPLFWILFRNSQSPEKGKITQLVHRLFWRGIENTLSGFCLLNSITIKKKEIRMHPFSQLQIGAGFIPRNALLIIAVVDNSLIVWFCCLHFADENKLGANFPPVVVLVGCLQSFFVRCGSLFLQYNSPVVNFLLLWMYFDVSNVAQLIPECSNVYYQIWEAFQVLFTK